MIQIIEMNLIWLSELLDSDYDELLDSELLRWNEILDSDYWDELLDSDYWDELLDSDYWDELLDSDYWDELLDSDYWDKLLDSDIEMNYLI